MPDTEAKNLEDNQILCQKITEILEVLSRAEKQEKDLYVPLRQIERNLSELQDEYLSSLHQRLLNGFETGKFKEQSWADEYFAFILLLCNLMNEIENSASHGGKNETATKHLVPA
jgi:hypothetical protein